jgi:hypothetical protein
MLISLSAVSDGASFAVKLTRFVYTLRLSTAPRWIARLHCISRVMNKPINPVVVRSW